MTRDFNGVLDDNTFLSGVKVLLHPNISYTVGTLKIIGIKVEEIKKNNLQTVFSKKLTDSTAPCVHPALSSFLLFRIWPYILIREVPDQELMACQTDDVAHR